MLFSLIILGIFIVLLILGVPIAFCFILSGIAGIIGIRGLASGLSTLGVSAFSEPANYILVAIPLFVLMGQMIFYSGLSKELYYTTYRWLGRLRGGLAQATITTCAVFAACTGSSMASVGTIAPIAMSEMDRYNYNEKLAVGCIASGGTLGILIPPSLAFIVYGYICEVPIGPLFIAGIVPGILLTLMLMLTVWVICKVNPTFGPPGEACSVLEKIKSLKEIWWAVAILFTILGGIYFGFFTPTEAAGMGAFAVFVILLITRRMTWEVFYNSVKDSVRITCMIFTIFIGAKVFNTFLGLSGIPQMSVDYLTQLSLSPWGILLIILIAYIPLGCFIDSMPLALLTLPIVFPVVQSLGFDPLYFGVLHVITGEISLITPPVGMNAYVLGGVTGKKVEDVFRGTVPFLIAMIVTMIILFLFPSISTLLPGTMMK